MIRWYVDGKLYHEESSWYSTTEGQGTLTYPAPFDQPFYIILNLAVGGSWVGNPTDETSFDNNPYVIDYVKVYQKDEYDENVEAPAQEFNPRDPDENGNYITSNNSDWVFLTALGGEASANIDNGNIQEGTGHLGYWTVSDPENASVTSFSDGRKLKVEGPLSISQDDLTFKEGLPYALSFYASTMSDGQVQISVGGKTFTAELDGNYKQYSFKIPGDTAFTGQDVVISFTGNGPIYFDNVMLVEDSMIKNGSFNDGLTGYEVYVDSSVNASYVVDSLSEDNALDVTVNNTGDQDWKIQIKQNNVKLEQGKTYKLSLRAKSSLEREIRVIMQGLENKGWAVYSNDNIITLTDEYQYFEDVFTMNAETDEAAEIAGNKLNAGLLAGTLLNHLNVSWGKVPGASGYEIYAAKCDVPVEEMTLAKTVKGNSTFAASISKVAGATVSEKGNYMVLVKAYKNVDGEKKYLGTSEVLHVAGTLSKTNTNALSVTTKKLSYTMTAGSTAALGAKVVKASLLKPLLGHRGITYWSSNKDVATVSADGTITAVGSGSCYVYAMAENGVKTRICVKVK